VSYYESIEEDLKRAREILERGKLRNEDLPASLAPDLAMRMLAQGGTIHAVDTYAAYKLLASFVTEIEARGQIIELYERQLAMRDTDVGRGHDEIERLRAQVADIDHVHEQLFVLPLLAWAEAQPPGEGIAPGEIDWGTLVARIIREHGEGQRWKDAIIDACVVDWIYTRAHDTDPRQAVNDLLAWQQQIVLDPAISKEAAELHGKIAEERAEIARLTQALTDTALAHMREMRDRDAEIARLQEGAATSAQTVLDLRLAQAEIERLRAHAAESARMRALIDAVGEKVCELALRQQHRQSFDK
jgi:hypothetical protein